jgi:hypothetical protein
VQGLSERIILICEECGDRIILIGPREVWHSEDTVFECECGERSTLASALEEESPHYQERQRSYAGTSVMALGVPERL